MPLTDATVRATKPTSQRQEIADGKGLFLVVGTSGSKSWVLRYKDRTGKTGRKTLGNYPDLRLSDARTESVIFKKSVKMGEQSVATRGAQRVSLVVSRDAMTVSQAYAHYMTQRGKGLAKGYERENNFKRDVAPAIGERPLLEVTRDELADLFQAKFEGLVEAGHSGRGVANLHAELSAFFGWCTREGYGLTRLATNPMASVPKPAKIIARDRWLSEQELKWFFEALPKAGAFAAPIELLLRSCARRSEIMKLKRENVALIGPLGPHLIWGTTKNGKPQLLPLTPQMAALIPDLTDVKHGEGIWRSPRSKGSEEGSEATESDVVAILSPEALSKPKGRVEAKMEELAAKAGANRVEPWVLHDLRRTGATMMSGMVDEDFMPRIQPHIVERVLNHVQGGVAGIYNRHAYYAEKRAALTLWNDYLDTLR